MRMIGRIPRYQRAYAFSFHCGLQVILSFYCPHYYMVNQSKSDLVYQNLSFTVDAYWACWRQYLEI